MIETTNIEVFDINDTPKNSKKYFWLKIISDGLGNAIRVPVMVARGAEDGPVLGLTAAVHGNELNGIPVIQRLFSSIDTAQLKGSIVAIPVVNIPSFNMSERRYIDGVDLNHIMPGKIDGNASQVYGYRVLDRIINKFDYLLDLHTASFGRVNTYYVRADMSNPKTKILAELQNAQIIVNNPPSDGTLRGAVAELGIPAITLEVGNPNIYQKKLIRSGIAGVDNVLAHLGMITDPIEPPEKETVLCKQSYWIYTSTGGLLTVHVDLMARLKKGDHLATMRDVFGNVKEEYYVPQDGIVIGKSVSPVNHTGGRIVHLGLI